MCYSIFLIHRYVLRMPIVWICFCHLSMNTVVDGRYHPNKSAL